ncbi:MAG: hypothetical protein V7782_13275 [Psychromonas sp.]
MKLIISLSMLLSFSVGASQCALPTNIQEYDYDAARNSRDWQNPNTPTDSFSLTLSWSPAYCAERSATGHQCGASNEDQFGLIVHGLWAQSASANGNHRKHPRNCSNPEAIKVATLKKHLCMMPGVKLIQNQWEKHGTCDFDSPEAYLDKTNQLYSALTIPSIQQTKQVEYKSWKEIADWLVSYNQHLGLKRENVYVHMRNKRLSEIRVCYDLAYQFTNCR